MEIRELELFDLYGDGTLVMKTNVDELSSDMRFCWYVKEKGRIIHKGTFQKNPFLAFQLPYLGKYTVKAFVRNEAGEKREVEVEFEANRKTSPQLYKVDENIVFPVQAKVEHISGGFWNFWMEGEIPTGTKVAWYIYKEGEAEPIMRTTYFTEANYTYKFSEEGIYHAKMFILADGKKKSMMTEAFRVVL